MLLPAETLHDRVIELAEEIDHHYRGREVLVVTVLRGAFIFAGELIRHLKTPVTIDFICLESYGDDKCPSHNIHIRLDLAEQVADREVLIVEDIIDTGCSMNLLLTHLYKLGAADVKVCSLLDKPSRREVDVEADWIGFTIPDIFVVGFGIDYAQRYRNLPDIYELDNSN